MSYQISIYPSNTRVLCKTPGGLSNQYFLAPAVTEWLNQYDPTWHLEHNNMYWHRDTCNDRMDIWLPYEDPSDNNRLNRGPAVFVFEKPDMAILFKLTWG